MELYRKEYSKGFHRGSLLNIFYDKLAYKSRMLDTMFSNKPFKAASLALQTEFLENDNYITSILGTRGKERREKGEKERKKGRRKTQSANLFPLWPGLHRYSNLFVLVVRNKR